MPGGEALRRLADETETTGVHVHLAVADQVVHLPPVLQLTVVRVVQEALTNVRRHARATTCWVQVDVSDDGVEIAVDDDGTGCAAPVPGHGLIGMGERVRLVGGTLRVAPSERGGLAVRAHMPRQA